MNYQWILLAFFLVAVITGTVKALKRDMLRNLLRLGAVVVAFLITFFLQLGGVFQGIATSVANAIGISSMLEGMSYLTDVIVALAGTIVSAIVFVPVFFIILGILYIVIFVTLKIVAKKNSQKDEKAEEKEEESEGKKKKAKKPIFYREKAWKRAVSVASGIIGGILILSVSLMPIFYIEGLMSTVVHAADETDAQDSEICQVIDVVDEYFVAPYEDSFVGGFYKAFGLSDLMSYTAKLGGKIVLEDGSTAYIDDTVKSVLSHGISVAVQLTSPTSDAATVKDDVNAIVTDPILSSVAADALMGIIADMENEKPEEDDLLGGLIYNFLQYYKEADKATIQKDLAALGNTIGVLAEEKVFATMLEEDVDLALLLENEEMLGNVVSAISGLSAFGPTLEDAFGLGIDILGDTLAIPENNAAAYDIFMEDLLTQMKKDNSTAFDMNTIRYFIVKCAESGVRVSSSNGIKGYSQFNAYVTHWKKVQSAFAHASEDKSYGYFTIEISGKWYIYDESAKKIIVYNDETEAAYKEKISPVAGVINALTQRSTKNRLTRDNVYTILTAYVSTATDEVSVKLAQRILDKDNFVSAAVTIEKMQAATNFSDWTDEEKAKDSKLCVNIIMQLLSLMENLSSADSAGSLEDAVELVDQFVLLGETMDMMKETSCINQLPSLLIEAVVKNEMLADYMSPSIAFQVNNIVENNNKTYAECMNQIAGILRLAIHSFGSSIGG